MATHKRRPVQTTKQRQSQPAGPWLWAVAGAAVVIAIAAIVGVAVTRSDGGGGASNSQSSTTAGLPDTPDYHSLAVDPSNPNRILLGTHQGLYSSDDGGKTWVFDTL